LVLTLLLTSTERDARLHRIILVAPGLVHVVEGLLWSCPLIVLAASHSLRDGATIASGVAVAALLSGGAGRSGAPRSVRRATLTIPNLLPEWTVGVRRTAPVVVVALLGGLIGSGSPGVVVLALVTIGLTTSAFFWRPAEGWLLIHARGQAASRFVSHKLLASVGMLAAWVVPLVLVGALRAPEYGLVYCLALAMCLHAHAAAVVVKYAAYREGQPLDASGTVIWMLTALAILVPPVGLLMLLWLHRRATARIAIYCPSF
jgi:hypothetical protein